MEKEITPRKPDNNELDKATIHIIVEIIEYMANAVVTKTILKKSTGNISVMSFDSGEGLTEKRSLLIMFQTCFIPGRELLSRRTRQIL